MTCLAPRIREALALVALLALLPHASAQTLSLIRSNGPPDRRINFVVFSEGYTSAQLGTFRANATNLINAVLNAAPFSQYRSCFNAFAVSVASNESGSDHPVESSYRDTYFSTYYQGNGSPEIIEITPAGLAKVNALVASLMPQCDVPVVLVNDSITGGSGGEVLICNNAGGQDIITHELGHTLAGLGDEYETPWPGYTSVEEPNTTQQTNRNLIKWKDWIAPATPVPTAPGTGYDTAVGLFEGANYHETGWYRPKLTCRMRDLAENFCEVCTEALVLSIYGKVRPINDYSPKTNPIVRLAQTVTFSVSKIPAPAGTPVVQWSLDNVAVPGATQTTFQVAAGGLSNGLHAVKAEVRDVTTLVRTDPSQLLRQTQTWQLQVDIPSLRLAAVRPSTTNGFGVRVTGTASLGVVLEGSTNLTSWQAVATNAFTAGSYQFNEPLTNKLPRRFYRARAL
jgi:hypothetical protein